MPPKGRVGREDFSEYENIRTSRHEIADKTIFPMTPLALLIAKERVRTERRNMAVFERAVERTLDSEEQKFLFGLLGRQWHKRMYLSGLNTMVETVPGYIQKIIPVAKEKLQILRDSLPPRPRLEEAVYLASQPYFLTTEKETIETYRMVLEADKRFPAHFFAYDNGRKAGIVIRHMYKQIRGLKPEEVFQKATKKEFEEHRLSGLLQNQFRGSVREALQQAYPKVKYPALYPDDKKPETGLNHLVSSLDEMFG